MHNKYESNLVREIAWQEAIRSAVKPDSYAEIYHWPKSPRMGMLGATICVLVILFAGWGISKLLGI